MFYLIKYVTKLVLYVLNSDYQKKKQLLYTEYLYYTIVAIELLKFPPRNKVLKWRIFFSWNCAVLWACIIYSKNFHKIFVWRLDIAKIFKFYIYFITFYEKYFFTYHLYFFFAPYWRNTRCDLKLIVVIFCGKISYRLWILKKKNLYFIIFEGKPRRCN